MKKSSKYKIVVCNGKHIVLGQRQAQIVEYTNKHKTVSYDRLRKHTKLDVRHLYVVVKRLSDAGVLQRLPAADFGTTITPNGEIALLDAYML